MTEPYTILGVEFGPSMAVHYNFEKDCFVPSHVRGLPRVSSVYVLRAQGAWEDDDQERPGSRSHCWVHVHELHERARLQLARYYREHVNEDPLTPMENIELELKGVKSWKISDI